MKAVSPEGNPIIGTLEFVEGVALADITIGDNGGLNVEYSGETEVDWDRFTLECPRIDQRTLAEGFQLILAVDYHEIDHH